MTYYGHYQHSTFGTALADSLDELVTRSEIPPHVAKAIMGHFDHALPKAFGASVKNKVTFKIDGKEIQLHGGQITACDQKTAATS